MSGENHPASAPFHCRPRKIKNKADEENDEQGTMNAERNAKHA